MYVCINLLRLMSLRFGFVSIPKLAMDAKPACCNYCRPALFPLPTQPMHGTNAGIRLLYISYMSSVHDLLKQHFVWLGLAFTRTFPLSCQGWK